MAERLASGVPTTTRPASRPTSPSCDRIAGIVFDAVGTLIDPVPSVAEVYAAAARRQGLVIDRALVRERFVRHFGDDEVDEMRGPLATDEGREFRRWRRIVANVLPEVPDPERGFRELWDHFGHPGAWRCFDDVGPALRALADAGLSIRIASNFDSRLREVVQGLPDLLPWADPVLVSSEIGYRKPHADFYQAACASLRLSPDRVLFVGDDPENDVEGPRRAGLQAILVDRGGRGARDLPRLSGLAELATLILG